MGYDDDYNNYKEPNDTQLLYYVLMMLGSSRQDLINAYDQYTEQLCITIDGDI